MGLSSRLGGMQLAASPVALNTAAPTVETATAKHRGVAFLASMLLTAAPFSETKPAARTSALAAGPGGRALKAAQRYAAT